MDDGFGFGPINAGGGGGGSVNSVTGLNTDNSDPANPIVKIAVDNSTITGTGTTADPLVSSGGSGLWTDDGSGNVYRPSGQVGIGTATPQQELHIKGSGPIIRVEATNAVGNSYIEFYDPVAEKGYVGYGGTGNENLNIINKESTGNLLLGTNTQVGLEMSPTQVIKLSNLAGTGTRMVTTDPSGTLATQPLPSGGSPNLNLISTDVYQNDGTNQGTTPGFGFPTGITLEQVTYTPPIAGGSRDVACQFVVPNTTYVRIKILSFIDTGSSSTDTLWYGLHNTNADVLQCEYGFQVVGVDDDFANQSVEVQPVWDIAVADLKNSTGGALTPGDTCTIFLKATSSVTGANILFGRWWPSVNITSTTNQAVGPLIFEVYSLEGATRSVNPTY